MQSVFGKGEQLKTPIKAIREKCIECSGGNIKEVFNCNIPDCALYIYRFGKNPNRKGIGCNKKDAIKNLQMRKGVIK